MQTFICDKYLNDCKMNDTFFKEIQNELRELTDDEMDDFLARKYGAIQENSFDSSSG